MMDINIVYGKAICCIERVDSTLRVLLFLSYSLLVHSNSHGVSCFDGVHSRTCLHMDGSIVHFVNCSMAFLFHHGLHGSFSKLRCGS